MEVDWWGQLGQIFFKKQTQGRDRFLISSVIVIIKDKTLVLLIL